MEPFDEATRRKLRDEIGTEILQHPSVVRMERNMHEGGKWASEVYRIEGSTPDKNLYFDIYSLRKWASENVEPNLTGLDTGRLQAMLDGGAVDLDRVANIPPEKIMEPIIIGVAAHENGSDAVLDGQHRYAAAAIMVAQLGAEIEQFPIAARFVEPDQWREFLIPRHVAVALRMDAPYEGRDAA